MLLIVSLPSQGMVSKASRHINVGLSLPAGRAISWEAQRWSLRGTVFKQLSCLGLGVFLDTLRQLPLTHYYLLFFFFLASLGFKQCFLFAYKDCCLSPFLPFSVRASFGHLSRGKGSALSTLLEHIWGTALYLELTGPLSRPSQERFRINPWVDHLCLFLLPLLCPFFSLGLSLKETRKTDSGGHIHNLK